MEEFLLGTGKLPRTNRLKCAHWLLRQQLQKIKREQNSVLLSQLTGLQPVLGPADVAPLNRLSAQLLAQQNNDLALSRCHNLYDHTPLLRLQYSHVLC